MRTWLLLSLVVIGCGSSDGGDLHGAPGTGGGGGEGAVSAGGNATGGEPTAGAASGGLAGGGVAGGGTGGQGAAQGGGGSAGFSGSAGAPDDVAGGGGAETAGAGGTPDNGGAGGAGGSPECVPSGDELCDGVDNDCANGIDDASICPTDCYGFADGDARYMICVPSEAMARDLASAQTFCKDHDASYDLVRIDGQSENDFLVASIESTEYPPATYWIGATTDEEAIDWSWPDGTIFYDHSTEMTVNGGWANWGPNRPNNIGNNEHCAVLIVNTGMSEFWDKWNDVPCDDTDHGFVCEAAATNL
jgi:hypothetical protein